MRILGHILNRQNNNTEVIAVDKNIKGINNTGCILYTCLYSDMGRQSCCFVWGITDSYRRHFDALALE